jgi:predicted DNA-binding WGR domain protein
MSDWTVSLEFEEGTSSKFWRARVEGKTLYVNYGKLGSTGQTQVKDFADPATAAKEYDKLVKEKRKKGYVDAGGGSGDAADDDEDLDEADDEGDDDDEDEAPKKGPISKPMPPTPAPAARPLGGTKLVLEAGNRKVETYLYLDGKTVRMDAVETYASPESAKKAHERLKKTLLGEGYKDG